MFRKFCKSCFVVSICLLTACSSTQKPFQVSSTTQSVLQETTTTHHSGNFSIERSEETEQLTTLSLPENKTVLNFPENKKEPELESVLEISQQDYEDKSEVDVEDEEVVQELQEKVIRIPEKNTPLSVVSIGDSVSFDAEPGIRAALESTGVINLETRSFGGIGISLEGFDQYLEEALVSAPEIVTVMLGGFDLKFVSKNESIYREMLSKAVNRILKDASRIIWIGMPPTPLEEKLEESRLLFNLIIQTFAENNPMVDYLDSESILGGAQGDFQRILPGVDGQLAQIRKVRDGRDDGHLCSAGAALIGELVYQKLSIFFPLAERDHEWWLGEWTQDQRYDDPPGGCSYNPVK